MNQFYRYGKCGTKGFRTVDDLKTHSIREHKQ